MAQTGWLIANPAAGQKADLTTNPAWPEEARAALARAGVAADLHLTEYARHATALARAAASAGVQLVEAAGGDGTVREVATGLIGTQTVLGILPLGSVMNTARALNIPRDLEQAAANVERHRGRHIDVDGVRRRLPMHADGQALGRTPAAFELLPGALRVRAGSALPGGPSAVLGSEYPLLPADCLCALPLIKCAAVA